MQNLRHEGLTVLWEGLKTDLEQPVLSGWAELRWRWEQRETKKGTKVLEESYREIQHTG